MISVIIPTYQHGQQIKSCLNSLFAQTYKNFEIIVVNDGSTDDTMNILGDYSQKITVVNQKNSGANIARNNGAKIAKGDYLLFCDADIVANHSMLEEMKNALDKNQQAAYAYSDFMWGAKAFRLFTFSRDELRKKNYIHTSSLIRRDCFPGFDETINRLQDWDLWLTMLQSEHTGTYIPKVLFSVKPRKSGMSGWLPSIVYKIPWGKFGVRIKRLESYKEAEKIIKTKHSIT